MELDESVQGRVAIASTQQVGAVPPPTQAAPSSLGPQVVTAQMPASELASLADAQRPGSAGSEVDETQLEPRSPGPGPQEERAQTPPTQP